MRSCVLILAFAATTALSSTATSSVLTVGGTHASQCYRAAEARRVEATALQACDIAIASDPLSQVDLAGTFVNRGILYMLSGANNRALNDFAEAEKLDPAQPEIYLNRAVLAYRAGNAAQARELASRSLTLGTRKPAYAHYIRGISNEDLGSIKAAYQDLSRAASLAPGWSDPKRELARYRVR